MMPSSSVLPAAKTWLGRPRMFSKLALHFATHPPLFPSHVHAWQSAGIMARLPSLSPWAGPMWAAVMLLLAGMSVAAAAVVTITPVTHLVTPTLLEVTWTGTGGPAYYPLRASLTDFGNVQPVGNPANATSGMVDWTVSMGHNNIIEILTCPTYYEDPGTAEDSKDFLHAAGDVRTVKLQCTYMGDGTLILKLSFIGHGAAGHADPHMLVSLGRIAAARALASTPFPGLFDEQAKVLRTCKVSWDQICMYICSPNDHI